MKKLLIIITLIFVSVFLTESCNWKLIDSEPEEPEEPNPECLINYSYYWDTSDTCGVLTYSVTNTGNCEIYRVDIYWNLSMNSDAFITRYSVVGNIKQQETSEDQHIRIYNEGRIEDVSVSYVISDWEGKD